MSVKTAALKASSQGGDSNQAIFATLEGFVRPPQIENTGWHANCGIPNE
jgi:hypothetical protein